MSQNRTQKSLSVYNRHILICKEIKSVKVFAVVFEEEILLGLLYINNGLKHYAGTVLNKLTH